MANSTLDESQKRRSIERLGADLEAQIAVHNSHQMAMRIADAIKRAENCKEVAKQNHYKVMIRGLEQEESTIKTEVLKLRWKACKLYLLAPPGDVAPSERCARIAHVVRIELILPAGRFVGRNVRRMSFISLAIV